MWKVDTTQVFRSLFVTDIFLTDLFQWLNENKNKRYEDIKTNLDENTTLLGEVANSLDSFYEKLLDIVSHEKIDEIINAYEAMEKDYFTYLEGGAHKVMFSESAFEIVKKTFAYFYKELLDRSGFWDIYNNGKQSFSITQFRKNLGIIRPICPYCDATKIQHYKQSNSDHFLAYSHFPFLSIKWENLVVSCLGCNLYIKNDKFIGTKDGVASNIPILHPYFHEAANHINFNFDDDLTITIKKTQDVRVNNYIDLFELEDVYEGAHHDVKTLWNEVLDNIQDKFENYESKENETESDKLKRVYLSTVINKRSIVEGAKGKVGYTKLFIDLCDFKLSEGEMSKELSFLQKSLGIPKLEGAIS